MTTRKSDAWVEEIAAACRGREEIRLMEVCGTHTVALFRTGVRRLLPANLQLLSGPGCPVCVTSQGFIDAAIEASRLSGVTICTYGDMMRVPGRSGSLAEHRAQGAKVVVVYSARDALQYALEHPTAEVIFLAVGFETTTPGTALVVKEAAARQMSNFSVLTAHKLVIPALRALLAGGNSGLDGLLCPGHVSVIIGSTAYAPIAAEYQCPCVIAGFEPEQLLAGTAALVRQVTGGVARVETTYGVAVKPEGNPAALAFVDEIFEPADAVWRAMGTIPGSGLVLRPAYAQFNAAERFGIAEGEDYDPPGCRCGEVIQGKLQPPACALFAKGCTPDRPVGPCMVSSEGTCSAWYKYGRQRQSQEVAR